MSSMIGIEHLEKDFWEAADQLRTNSKLTSSEYVMPVFGIIFLRQANNRFETVHEQLTSYFREGKTPFEPQRADYINAGSLWLPEKARWSYIMAQAVSHKNLRTVLIEAMEAIEASFEPLSGVIFPPPHSGNILPDATSKPALTLKQFPFFLSPTCF